MEIQLYTKKYKGTKVMFNSRKGAGAIIEGIAVQIVPQLNVIVLRDRENFPHAVYKDTIREVV